MKLKFTDYEKEIIASRVSFSDLNRLKKKLYVERGAINYSKHIRGNTNSKNPARNRYKETIAGTIKGLQQATDEIILIKQKKDYFFIDSITPEDISCAFKKFNAITSNTIKKLIDRNE